LIAEGVETAEQAELLLELGCATGQGFLYAPALEQEALEKLLDLGLVSGSGPKTGAVA
jgi:EAL domain-containing protein (putative c-di-GMP-specific phosphodiesterase class I)